MNSVNAGDTPHLGGLFSQAEAHLLHFGYADP